MDRRIWILVFAVSLGAYRQACAQSRPDFSGIWALDSSRSDAVPYGQLRVISQSSDAIDFTAIAYAGAPQTRGLHVIPWKLRLNRWSPRRGGENSQEPKVQARWDREKLIYVKAPGESFSVLFIWSLEGPDELLVEEVNWTNIPADFDFKEQSIPSAYVRCPYIYRRVPDIRDWSPEANGQPVTLSLKPNELNITCHAAECIMYDIVGGRRVSSQKHRDGSVLRVSLSAQTTIEFGATR